MKYLLYLLLFCLAAVAASVGFTWEDTLNPPDTTYRLYVNGLRFVETTEKIVTVNLPAGTNSVLVRAVSQAGLESDDSNVVPVLVPHAVQIRIIVVP